LFLLNVLSFCTVHSHFPFFSFPSSPLILYFPASLVSVHKLNKRVRKEGIFVYIIVSGEGGVLYLLWWGDKEASIYCSKWRRKPLIFMIVRGQGGLSLSLSLSLSIYIYIYIYIL
jgi:hypothetical protein